MPESLYCVFIDLKCPLIHKYRIACLSAENNNAPICFDIKCKHIITVVVEIVNVRKLNICFDQLEAKFRICQQFAVGFI